MRVVLPLGFLSVVACCCGLPSQFAAHTGTLTPACSSLGDYCAQAECGVTNNGSSRGEAVVHFELTEYDGKKMSGTERTTLGPGEFADVYHDFTGARLKSADSATFRCWTD